MAIEFGHVLKGFVVESEDREAGSDVALQLRKIVWKYSGQHWESKINGASEGGYISRETYDFPEDKGAEFKEAAVQFARKLPGWPKVSITIFGVSDPTVL